MEIVPISLPPGDTRAVGLPFNRRNVEEWSRLDKLTGMMEKTKIETDHWSASDNIAKHNYGKVVDSRERNRPDGSVQQRQRKQMEIFQTKVPGGSMQVIRSQTVTTSSSNWSSTTTGKTFDELQLPVNALDLSSQKTKGSVGRSGSISGRRPPSRPRSLISHQKDVFNDVAAECHRIHEEVKARMFGGYSNGFGHDRSESPSGVVITELDSPTDSSQKTNLSRQKSCSNEHVNEETEENNSIRRSSRFRRSLQFPKSSMVDDFPDYTNGKSLKERAAEIENLLRCGGTTNFEVDEESEPVDVIEKQPKVKSSFVSAQTLKEVRDRLRRSSNSDNDTKDDGIVVEPIHVKEYVSGMEAKMATPKPIVNGTGSLESRITRNQLHHTSEWYRRRKSYGFESVEEPDKLARQSNGESSTDSGFGQSTDANVTAKESPFRRYIQEPSEAAWNRKSPLPSRERSSLRATKNPWISQLRGTKLVDRQWYSDTPDPEQNDSGVPDSPKSRDDEMKVFDFENAQKKQKKVEFCKTEVHFAAESGRFNIVETDGKPPPNNMMRRRKKTSSVFTEHTSGLPELKFGDTLFEKNLLSTAPTVTNSERIDSLSQKIESELKELSKIVVEALPNTHEDSTIVQTPSLPKLYDLEEEYQDGIDSTKPRSILKALNATVLSEPTAPVWKSTVVLRNKRFEDVKNNVEERKSYSSDGESELQIRFRNLRRTEAQIKVEPITIEVKRRSLPDDVLLNGGLKPVDFDNAALVKEDRPILTVAERIKRAEEFRSKNYSTKIDFRSGEMTVLQNGAAGTGKTEKKEFTTWSDVGASQRRSLPLDSKLVSNPSVKRFSTSDVPNTTTTRISINIPCEKSDIPPKTKPYRSWSFAAKTPASDSLQSTSLVMQTLKDKDINKNPKSVHDMINKFDSLAKPVRNREQRRRTMPINYKAPKVYTHADLEEELRNFTEDLDKDFKDIYEEEIGSLKGSCKDLKNIFDQVSDTKEGKPVENKARTLPLVNGFKKRQINNGGFQAYKPTFTNGHDEFSGTNITNASESKVQNGCLNVYDSDDSDLLADEEVRSYMSAGHGESESEGREVFVGVKKKSFDRLRRQFKKLEETSTGLRKESKSRTTAPKSKTVVDVNSLATTVKSSEPHYIAPPKVATISLRYEDDPIFNSRSKTTVSRQRELTDRWEKTSNTSSTKSDRPKERASYLNGPSLSEKYSKKNVNASLDNLSDITALTRAKDVHDTFRSSVRSEGSVRSSRVREVQKTYKHVEEKMCVMDDTASTLDELSRAADEILVAVNGMTDDDSILASSEEEDVNRRIIKKGKVSNLSTISEGRKASLNHGRNTPEVEKKDVRDKSLSSRATRLLQRANHREASMGQRSSSEDIPANIEPARKKLMRKPRPVPVKVEKAEKAEKVSSKTKTRTKKEELDNSIPRERCKTVSSAAKEVSKSSTKTYQQTSERLDRIERTKASQRRELLSKADAAAELSTKKKRSTVTGTAREEIYQSSSVSKRRAPRISLRKVESARLTQAV